MLEYLDIVYYSKIESYASKCDDFIERAVFDVKKSQQVYEHMIINKKSLIEYYDIIVKDHPDIQLINKPNINKSRELGTFLYNMNAVMNRRVNLGKEFWTALQTNEAWLTGCVMASSHFNMNDSINIMCPIGNISKLINTLDTTYKYMIVYVSDDQIKFKCNITNYILTICIHPYIGNIMNTIKQYHYSPFKAIYNGSEFKCLPSYMISMFTGIFYNENPPDYYVELYLFFSGYALLTNDPLYYIGMTSLPIIQSHFNSYMVIHNQGAISSK